MPIEITVVLGIGNPAGREDWGIRTEPLSGGPWLKIWMFVVGTVAKNPGVVPTGLTWTRLVGDPSVTTVAWLGMLKAISGFAVVVDASPGALVIVVGEVVDVVVEFEVEPPVVSGVVEVEVVDDVVEAAGVAAAALADVMPETC